VEKLVPENLCQANHNGTALAAFDKPSSPFASLTLGEEQAVKIKDGYGYCEATVQAVRDSYAALLKARVKTCRRAYESISEQVQCIKKGSDENCDEEAKKVQASLKEAMDTLGGYSAQTEEFIQKLSGNNKLAKAKYETDRKALRSYFSQFRKNAQRDLHSPSVQLLNGRIPAENGGASSIGEYLRKLNLSYSASASSVTVVANGQGKLIDEQNQAGKLADDFRNALNAFSGSESQAFYEKIDSYQKLFAKDSDSFKSLTDLAGPAGPIASSAISRNSSTDTSTTNSANGDISPGSPALAAASLASATASQNGGSGMEPTMVGSGGDAAPTRSAPAAQNQDPAASAPPASVAANQIPPPQDTNPAMNGAKASTTGAGSTNNPLIATGQRDHALAEKPETTKKAGPNLQKASGQSEELLTPFAGGLNHSPPHPSKHDDGMGEVTGLLGQMKNLFNFNESTAATPAPNGEAAGTGEDDLTGRSLASENGQGMENEMDASSAPDHAQGGNPFGPRGVSLFLRVHSCHNRSIQKGIVLGGLERIPQ
jgi:hypothetical protein